MKPVRCILLLGVLLLLMVASAPQSVGAQSDVTLKPGLYQGKYTIEVMSITYTSISAAGSSMSTNQVYSLRLEGTLDIAVLAKDKGRASPSASESGMIYQMHMFTANAKDLNCSVANMLDTDAQAFGLAPLGYNFNPQSGSFTTPFTVNLQGSTTSNSSGASDKCNYPVSTEVLGKWISEITRALNTKNQAEFLVYYVSDTRMAGMVQIPGWDSRNNIPHGILDQTSTGTWWAIRSGDIPKDWD